jgi:hypothetical protein
MGVSETMNVLQQIEKRSYLATDEQIRALAAANYQAGADLTNTGSTYLRILIAGTQAELGSTPRLRAVRGAKDAAPEMEAALNALQAVHERYYALVLEAITTEDVEDKPTLRKAEKSRRALERNRRGNFARTSASLVRAYIRAGCNILALVVPTATKSLLRSAVLQKKAPPTPEVIVERNVSAVVTRIEELQADRPDLATITIQTLLARLTSMATGGEKQVTTSSPKKAMAEGITLKLGEGIFLPLPPTTPAPSTMH